MTTAEKLVKIAENEQKVYKAGQKSEQDRFWDDFQKNGGTVNGTYMFSGHGWTDKIYAPKYPIKLSVGTGLFAFSDITDAKVEIDFTSTSGSDTHVFNWGQYFTNIPRLKVNENISYSNWFNYCISLEEIRFEGVIGKSLDIHWSTKLSMMSLASIVGALSKTVTGQTITLPTTARQTYDNATIGGAWDNLVSQYPKWSFAYL